MNFIREVKYKTSNNTGTVSITFNKKIEPQNKLLERIAFKTRTIVENKMLLLLDKSTHEENLSQPIQTKEQKQFKLAVTSFKGIFNVTHKNNNFIFITLFEGAEYNVFKLPQVLMNWKVQRKR